MSSLSPTVKAQLEAELGNDNRLRNSYLLCALAFFGFSGIHRLYNGKYLTGVLWFLTLGLFGCGQILDIFFMRGIVDQYELRLRRKLGASPDATGAAQTSTVLNAPQDTRTKDEKIVALIQSAQRHDGMLSVTQAVLETQLGFDEAEKLLRELAQSEYVEMTNDMRTGAIVYHFIEI
ncbi:MAG: NINE protein [Geitlerinemataceae cyanobacterium]